MLKMKKLKKGQFYAMRLSGYREYYSFGDNLEIMANNLLNLYNKYLSWNKNEPHSFLDMKNEEYEFSVYIVDLINNAFDDECHSFQQKGIYLGDYLDYILEKETK